MRTLWLVLALGGCKALPAHTDLDPGIDTGWFDDTDDGEPCEDRIVSTWPEAGYADWYWKDDPRVQVATDEPNAYKVALYQQGLPLDIEVVYEASGLAFSVTTPLPLNPENDYLLELKACDGDTLVPFSTNRFGLPLEEGTAALRGNTYLVDLAGAEWVEPGGFGSLMKAYFANPVLIGVTYAQDPDIDLMGAVGLRDDLGVIHQDPSQATFDFPVSANSELPWFDASSDIEISIDGAPIPIYGFDLSGTFAPDGSAIGGATVKGLGDTRAMGALVGQPNDPAAVCTFAASLGASCTDCPDGEELCIQLEARQVDGGLIPGLELVRRVPQGARVPRWLRRLSAQLVALGVALHLVLVTLQGLPAPSGGMSKRDWANPTVQGEFAAWTARLNAMGVPITQPELEERLFEVASQLMSARGRVLKPFLPYYRLAGTWQSWRMFVAPHRYPSVLHIEVKIDGEYQLVYRSRSHEHAWLAPKLDHDRFRAAVFRYGWRDKYKRDFSTFSDWVAVQAARDHPEASNVRLRFFSTRTRTPDEVREGVVPTGTYINVRLRPVVRP